MNTRKRNLLFVISSVLTLLPILLGFIMWDKLPGQMYTHWDASMVADSSVEGSSGKLFVVVVMPLILLVINWICLLITYKDNKDKNNTKALTILHFIMPAIAMFVFVMVCLVGNNASLASTMMMLFFGLLFVVIGNYSPKFRQNHTMGVKIKWTLENKENWFKTHRVMGITSVIGGLVAIALCWIEAKYALFAILAITLFVVLVPTIYSYKLYKKQVKAGTYVVDGAKIEMTKASKIALTVVISILVVACIISMSIGKIEATIEGDKLIVAATMNDQIEVELSKIASVEYVEDFEYGMRTYGYQNLRIGVGNFANEDEAVGGYLAYITFASDDVVLLESTDGEFMAISLEDDEATRALYDELCEVGVASIAGVADEADEADEANEANR